MVNVMAIKMTTLRLILSFAKYFFLSQGQQSGQERTGVSLTPHFVMKQSLKKMKSKACKSTFMLSQCVIFSNFCYLL